MILGYQAPGPLTPELLDWLATRFRSEGWSMRKMIRLLVTSATYRQGLAPVGHRDVELFDSREPRRLTAEEIRDSLLAVAGLLRPSNGGPPAWPDLPEDVGHRTLDSLIENAEKTRGWYPSPPEETLVRSLIWCKNAAFSSPSWLRSTNPTATPAVPAARFPPWPRKP